MTYRYSDHLVREGTEFRYSNTAQTWLAKGCWADSFEANLPKSSASSSNHSPWAPRYADWKRSGYRLEQWGPKSDEP